MRAQNLCWKGHHTLADIYGNITTISRRLVPRWHQFAGHCFCNKSQIISELILWKLPSHTKGKCPLNYIDAVSHETNVGYEELSTAVSGRTYWRNFVVNTHLGWDWRKQEVFKFWIYWVFTSYFMILKIFCMSLFGHFQFWVPTPFLEVICPRCDAGIWRHSM